MAEKSESDTKTAEAIVMNVDTHTHTVEYRGRSPGPYIKGQNWKMYKTRFEMFCKLTDVKPDKKSTAFLQEIGEEAYTVLESLMQGVDPFESGKSYDDMVKLLDKSFRPKVHVLAERYRLIKMVQRPDQSLADFMVKIQEATKHCNFKEL